MIPLIRSTTELMIMTNSRKDAVQTGNEIDVTEESGQRRTYLHSLKDDQVSLPLIPKTSRESWVKSKKAIKKFFDDLDYNNQNISSYELTLMKKQEQKDYHNAA